MYNHQKAVVINLKKQQTKGIQRCYPRMPFLNLYIQYTKADLKIRLI